MDRQIASFRFEKLLVWQKAVEYSLYIYKISTKFPKSEIFGLQSQIRRSAVSIALNIAEGSGRRTKKDFRKFLHDSLGSLRESLTCLHIVEQLTYIDNSEFNHAYNLATEISKMLYRLEQSLQD
ncbi:MAG: four helix bundle protein [Patescibacteria group bacterium]